MDRLWKKYHELGIGIRHLLVMRDHGLLSDEIGLTQITSALVNQIESDLEEMSSLVDETIAGVPVQPIAQPESPRPRPEDVTAVFHEEMSKVVPEDQNGPPTEEQIMQVRKAVAARLNVPLASVQVLVETRHPFVDFLESVLRSSVEDVKRHAEQN